MAGLMACLSVPCQCNMVAGVSNESTLMVDKSYLGWHFVLTIEIKYQNSHSPFQIHM